MAAIPDGECSPVARIYNIQREEVSAKEGTPFDGVYLAIEEESRSPWIYSLQGHQIRWNPQVSDIKPASSTAGGNCNRIPTRVPTRVDPLPSEHDAVVTRLPEHLRCMLPPVGLLTTEQLEEVVELVLEYQDIFIGPDGKTNRVRHTIDVQRNLPIKVPN